MNICPFCDTEYSEKYLNTIKALEKLRQEKQLWQKVCAMERDRWQSYIKVFPGLLSEKEREHYKYLEKLL